MSNETDLSLKIDTQEETHLCTFTTNTNNLDIELPFQITLTSYTRIPATQSFQELTVQSKDIKSVMRFLDYLKQRKKGAFGSFGNNCLLLIQNQGFVVKNDDDLVEFRVYVTEDSSSYLLQVKQQQQNLAVNPNSLPPKKIMNDNKQQQQPAAAAPPCTTNTATKNMGGGGFLGSMLNSSKKISQEIKHLPKKTVKNTASGQNATEMYRKHILQTLSQFNSQPSIKSTRILASTKVFNQMTGSQASEINIVKYLIYETIEEFSQEYIAIKEDSDFSDEFYISVYKTEKDVPPDVLLDYQSKQLELPSEVLQQQKAIRAEQAKLVARQNKAQEMTNIQLLKQQQNGDDSCGDGTFAQLNSNKRDRRNLEEIQRDIHLAKRSKQQQQES